MQSVLELHCVRTNHEWRKTKSLPPFSLLGFYRLLGKNELSHIDSIKRDTLIYVLYFVIKPKKYLEGNNYLMTKNIV